MNISLYKNISQVSSPPKLIKVKELLYDILGGKYKDLILNLRQSNDKSTLKRNLPCVVFSGEMTNGVSKVSNSGKSYISYRDDTSLTTHSGLCIFDFDHVTNLQGVKEKMCAIKEVYAVFVSPSGDGLKVLFKIPKNIKKHRGYYKSILLDLDGMGIVSTDSTSINESRLCFVSYDPDLYINEYAETYMNYIEDADDIVVVNTTVDNSHVVTDYTKLNISAKMIDSCDDGYKHHTLIKASYLMGGYIASGKVREEDAVGMLRTRILNRNVKDKSQAFKTISDGIAKGKNKPIYEIEEIESEFKTQLSKIEYEDEQRGYSFLVNNNEVDKKMMSYITDGVTGGYSTGSNELDLHFVFKENTFNVMLGHDNVGKSLLAWFLAVCASSLHGWKWIIYSPENKIHRIKKQLIDFVLGKQSNNVNPDMFEKAKQFVDSHFLFLRKDREYTVFELLEYGELLCKSDSSIKGFLIDPYNSLNLDYKNRGKGLSAYEYHLKSATNMRIFSEKYCTIYLNGHSVTGARRNMLDADGILMRPRKDDMEQGGLWANRADDFLVIHRKVKSEDEWMYTEIHVDKVKDVESGGRVTFDEPVKFKLMYGADFIDSSGNSPLTKWRSGFFHGKQEVLPLMETNDVF